ncbi:hypothetical protein A2U01_0027984, partial [Trifolium medium]|nr:hypothetical protein [Trifolium medium]
AADFFRADNPEGVEARNEAIHRILIVISDVV